MSRTEFYNTIRPMFSGGISAMQLRVIEAILAETAGWPIAWRAYTLATAFGEADCTPKRENMNYTAKRIRQVWPSRPEAARFAGDPQGLAMCVYNGRLGNRPGSMDGWTYRGGGLDQLTGRDHYATVGIASEPDSILHPDVAVKSLVHGMLTGRYRGRKLADYDGPLGFDYVAARGIVNADVMSNGHKYAGYARQFEAGLRALADVPGVTPVPVAPPHPAPPIAPAKPGAWAAIIAAFARFFGGKK